MSLTMNEIDINYTITANIERVFDAISDHEHFFRGSGFEYCRLTNKGTEVRNGVGAVREISVNGMVFTEEITRFERPTRLEYLVVKIERKSGSKIPLEHERGWIEFSACGSQAAPKTNIRWRSRFKFSVPLIGWLLEKISGRMFAYGFRRLLAQARDDVEAREIRDVH